MQSAALVGALSAFIPSVLLSGTLLIEVVALSVFLLALLAMVASLQEPSRRNQLLAIGGIALACLAKPLSVVLAPAYVLAVMHLGLLDRRSGGTVRARLRLHATSLGALGGGAAVAIVGPLCSVTPMRSSGSTVSLSGNIDVSGTLVWLVWHLAGLDLYVAVVPFAASLVLIALAVVRTSTPVWRVRRPCRMDDRRDAPRDRGVLVEAAGGGRRVHPERGAAPRAQHVRPGPDPPRRARALPRAATARCRRWLHASSLAVAVALPLLFPLERLLRHATLQALVVIPWTAGGIERLWPLTFLPLAAVAAAVVLFGPPERLARRAWTIVGVVFAFTTLSAHASMTHPEGGPSSTLGIGSDTRWIDHAVPRGTEVTALWVGRAVDRSESGPGRSG